MIFVLIYDRSNQSLDLSEYDDADEEKALLEKRAREARFRNDDSVEVVLLRSNDLETLKRTHSRYFFNATQIANNLKELAS
jgi:hypothetical protein